MISVAVAKIFLLDSYESHSLRRLFQESFPVASDLIRDKRSFAPDCRVVARMNKLCYDDPTVFLN